ncbi:hypothetical protein P4209_04675 [Pseudomonas aeruginosa]|nr:hypothetical protein [Pseudomonas aeruginosa]
MKIGVIGGGQLGRMLALAGTPLGMNFAFLDPAPDACAASWASTSAPTTATRSTCGNWPTRSTW